MENQEEIKEPVFDIPENYFADFEKRITAKIAEREKSRRFRNIRMYAVRAVAAAAVMTGVVFSVRVFTADQTVSDSRQTVYTAAEASTMLHALQQEYSGYAHEETESNETLPIGQGTLSDIIQENDMSVISVDQQSIYAIDNSAVEQYITDNYNIMELATL